MFEIRLVILMFQLHQRRLSWDSSVRVLTRRLMVQRPHGPTFFGSFLANHVETIEA